MRTLNTEAGDDTSCVRNKKSVLEARYACLLYIEHRQRGYRSCWEFLENTAKESILITEK
jgi:hypothetical protein